MIAWTRIRLSLNQIIAIAEKNIKVSLRFKISLIMGYLNPIITIIFPIIIMNKFFSFQENFGPWTQENYLIYLFIGYNVVLIQQIISEIPSHIMSEKYWSTLEALMIAPFSKFNLLFGIMLSHLFYILIPFIIFFIICYIIFPISFISVIAIIAMFLALFLIFAGMGILIGSYQVSNESIAKLIGFGIRLIFFFSCVSYPYQIFPDFIQSIINLNPIYYMIDIIRLTWIENNIIYTIITHPFHLLLLLLFLFVLPTIGVIIFNYVSKKYGIVGY